MNPNDNDDSRFVALYWDFENLHAGLMEAKYGEGAYGNWQYFGRYRDALLQSAVELIQRFPPGASAKNGADIKLCLDATEDISRFAHIGTVIIVGGDSDFMPWPRRSRPQAGPSSASATAQLAHDQAPQHHLRPEGPRPRQLCPEGQGHGRRGRD